MRTYRLVWKRGVGYWRAQVRVFGIWKTIAEFSNQADGEKAIRARMRHEYESRNDSVVIVNFQRNSAKKWRAIMKGNALVKEICYAEV